MPYTGYATFKAEIKSNVAWVTFDFPPVNVQGKPMLDDLNRLCEELEKDNSVKVVVFQSAHPDIFVCHADIDMLTELKVNLITIFLKNDKELKRGRKLLENVLQLRRLENLRISHSMFLTEPAIGRLEFQRFWFSNSYCLQHR